jgi:hypothetical protein
MASYIGNKFGQQDLDKLVSIRRNMSCALLLLQIDEVRHLMELAFLDFRRKNSRSGRILTIKALKHCWMRCDNISKRCVPGLRFDFSCFSCSLSAEFKERPATASTAETHTHTTAHLEMQLEDMRKNEDPRLSFSTPEFKEAQRIFTDGFKVRFLDVNCRMSNMNSFKCASCKRSYL